MLHENRPNSPEILVPRLGMLAVAPTILALTFGACGKGPVGGSTDLRSAIARDTSPGVSDDERKALTSGNTAFATDLYKLEGQSVEGNMALAPLGLSIALSMAYAGANGSTADQIAKVMHFDLSPPQLFSAFDDLALSLTVEAPTNTHAPMDASIRLTLADALWVQSGLDVLPSYLDVLAADYGSGLRAVDFAGDPDTSRTAINQWIADNTGGAIDGFFAPGTLNSSARVVLTDAELFNAKWLTPFWDAPGPVFHAPSGDITAPMITGDPVDTWKGNGWTAAALPYSSSKARMIIVMPDAGTFGQFESALSGDIISTILTAEAGTGIAMPVFLPKFRVATKVFLARSLESAGMSDAFDSSLADFSRIDGNRDLSISEVVHQASLVVNEVGTTATSATGVVLHDIDAMAPVLVVDRPFLFFIVGGDHDTILFEGRVLDPTM